MFLKTGKEGFYIIPGTISFMHVFPSTKDWVCRIKIKEKDEVIKISISEELARALINWMETNL